MSKARLAWAVVAFALLLLVSPAFAQPVASQVVPPIPVPRPPEPREEPIYIVANGNATLLRSAKTVLPASMYLAGKVQYRPWPIVPPKNGQPPTKSGWIKIDVLTVKVGERQFSLTGYGILADSRILIIGWSIDANVFIQGTIASDNTVRLQGVLLVRPRIKPINGGFLKPEVWRLNLQGFVSNQPPIQPLK